MSRAGLAGVLLLGGVIAFVLLQSMALQKVTCEVCVEYNGRQQCRTVAAATEDEAIQGAITNACAFISGGMTDSMACGRSEPASVTCK
jgi:hypothetical protein